MTRFLVATAAFAIALGPLAARAETTIEHFGSVEVISTRPDATPDPHPRRKRARTVAARVSDDATRSDGTLRGADTLVRTALSLLGAPYAWGGADTNGFDCSGFTYYAFARVGIRIPRTADEQFARGGRIAGDPLPGDLVFFQTYDYGPSHVGIYLGNGQFVNAIGPNVHVESFASPYFRSRYLGARRFLPV